MRQTSTETIARTDTQIPPRTPPYSTPHGQHNAIPRETVRDKQRTLVLRE